MQLSQFFPRQAVPQAVPSVPSRRRAWTLLPSVLFTVMLGWTGDALASSLPLQLTQTRPAPRPATPAPAAAPAATNVPAALSQFISRVDAAASEHSLDKTLAFYGPQFKTADGITLENMRAALTQFWQQYPNVTYRTVVNRWSQEGNAWTADVTTTVNGIHERQGRSFKLVSTLSARQRIEGDKIVSQEILSERSEIKTGAMPPSVDVLLSPQVAPNSNFEFDAIVNEPLGDRLLLGAALEEVIQPSGYLNPAPIELELLNSGGLFKIGRAPASGDRWISAVIIRNDGITAITQRLRVTPQPTR